MHLLHLGAKVLSQQLTVHIQHQHLDVFGVQETATDQVCDASRSAANHVLLCSKHTLVVGEVSAPDAGAAAQVDGSPEGSEERADIGRERLRRGHDEHWRELVYIPMLEVGRQTLCLLKAVVDVLQHVDGESYRIGAGKSLVDCLSPLNKINRWWWWSPTTIGSLGHRACRHNRWAPNILCPVSPVLSPVSPVPGPVSLVRITDVSLVRIAAGATSARVFSGR